MCANRNAVSRKHGEVTKEIWKSLFAMEQAKEVPIDYVTNGVHLPTWLGDEFFEVFDQTIGEGWLQMQDLPEIWERIEELDDRTIWNLHYAYKVWMVNFIRERVRRKWSKEGIDPLVAMAEGVMLDPDVLTIGFARRMTAYKRPDLILHDLDRLEKIVNDYARPVQIVFAGKAHPADNPGKKILQHIFKTAQDPRFRGRIAFVEDYGEGVAKALVRGVDLWLNNPKIPMEACGTSGMKAAINGTLHFSALDGWWPEGFDGSNGWVIGGERSDDAADTAALYDTLERQIVPRYYDVGEKGIPHAWIAMMRSSIKSVASSVEDAAYLLKYDSVHGRGDQCGLRRSGSGCVGGVLEFTTDEIVSTDIIGNRHSSIIDGLSTSVVGGRMVKVMAWYDNEYGYSQRLLELADYIAAKMA